ncbi:hypothetical protein PanWU01x14_126160 [Parasponia andersonii]|uniref:Uncharacterized protein n=1 Tax=Parasponia andersonii TaxID=3476 RepID=A0A2P5CTD4_PARAD|nr:hypothetical protein PanWU01x14_126160 [Parasponia andersonii]
MKKVMPLRLKPSHFSPCTLGTSMASLTILRVNDGGRGSSLGLCLNSYSPTSPDSF